MWGQIQGFNLLQMSQNWFLQNLDLGFTFNELKMLNNN